ncbi:hypothetical protein M1146_03725 [Patescibacteria group bacterium]|nr:hypothetical protein [Patescibacteria group bacterium]
MKNGKNISNFMEHLPLSVLPIQMIFPSTKRVASRSVKRVKRKRVKRKRVKRKKVKNLL